MGNAKIWWFPDANGTIEEIDLGERLADLQKNGAVVQAASESIAGDHFTNQTSARSMVRVVLERFVSFALARKLEALENHLRRGGTIAVAEDADHAIAGYLLGPFPVRGDTVVSIQSKFWPYSPAASLGGATPQEFVLQSASPGYIRELGTVASDGGLAFTLTDPLMYSYGSEPWVLFRHRGFWPMLRLPLGARNQTMLTHDHRISWTFDVQLEEHVGGLDMFSGIGDDEISVDASDGGIFLEQTDPGFLIEFGF